MPVNRTQLQNLISYLSQSISQSKGSGCNPNRGPSIPHKRSLAVHQWGVGLLLLSLALSSCNFRRNPQDIIDAVDNISVETLTDNQKLIENSAKGLRITVPSSWTKVETLRPDADLYAADETEGLYVLVLADNKDSLVGQFSLEDNSSQYRRILARQLDSYDSQVATDLTSVNGQEAIQYEIRGEIEDTPIVYLHTTIRGDSNYYQVIGWTRADQYDTQQTTLQGVIASFKGG